MSQSGASLGGGRYEEPNPRERFFASTTESQPARALSQDPTRVSGPGPVCFGAHNMQPLQGNVLDAEPEVKRSDFLLSRGVLWVTRKVVG